MTVDFGLVREPDGRLSPKLVEMQAFPSIFGYQDLLAQQYIESFGLDRELKWLLGGLSGRMEGSCNRRSAWCVCGADG